MERKLQALSQPLKPLNSWDTAIADAETRAEQARQLIAALKKSVRTFKRLRDRGEPFPGEKSKQTEAGA